MCEDKWLPISTAPKDGTEILLFTKHDGDEFCKEKFTAVQVGYWDEGCANTDWYRETGWNHHKVGDATHWKPLPAPPIRSARDGGAS